MKGTEEMVVSEKLIRPDKRNDEIEMTQKLKY